jgi:hypothetical protein
MLAQVAELFCYNSVNVLIADHALRSRLPGVELKAFAWLSPYQQLDRQALTAAIPRFSKYAEKTDREIPVIRLTPRSS